MFSSKDLQRRVCLVTAALALVVSVPAAQTTLPAKFTAFAVSLGGMTMPSGTATVDIAINRWSTTAERELLMKTLLEKGPENLLSVLQDMRPTGSIRTPNSLAYDLRFAYLMPEDEGGDRIILATDRFISFWEAVNRPRSIDYPFMLIELRISPDGEGEGKMSIATRIVADKKNNVVVLEDYGTQPVMLKQVRRVK